MIPPRSRLICLTPCRDEAWVMVGHLAAASQWADRIILGDQMSRDGTREIAGRFSKCWLVDNTASGYDEGERHRVVFEATRTLYPGEKKVLLAIDSDEVLSANWQTSNEWRKLQELPPGSAIYAEWVNVNPDLATWFPLGGPFIIGVVDDGKIRHSAGQFHVPRLQCDSQAPSLILHDIRLLHLQYADERRSQSKNRAYQVQEWLVKPERPIRLFRRFNSTLKLRAEDIRPMQPEWTAGFSEQGVAWGDVRKDGIYRWDKLVLEAILEKSPAFFRKLDIWDLDWNAIAQQHGVDTGDTDMLDPRSRFEKTVHAFLRKTQNRMSSVGVRMIQWLLRPMGW